jgi:hypothetical protein
MTTREWKVSGDGHDCKWCPGKRQSEDFEPFDAIEAGDALCRGHLAEYMGESLASLDRAEDAARADMADLGYFD